MSTPVSPGATDREAAAREAEYRTLMRGSGGSGPASARSPW